MVSYYSSQVLHVRPRAECEAGEQETANLG
jgi:hypothetical protein